jgi:replication factor A1
MASTIPEPSQPPSEQSDAKPALRKPEFKKVEQLKPSTTGHTLTVNVISSNTVLAKGRSVSHHLRQTRIAECVVGDDTGTIIFTARNEQGLNFSSSFLWFLFGF